MKPDSFTQAQDLVDAELQHQADHGYTSEHDDGHTNFEILRGADCFLGAAVLRSGSIVPGNSLARTLASVWPFDDTEFTPERSCFTNMVKAAAMLQAEIARCIRSGSGGAPKLVVLPPSPHAGQTFIDAQNRALSDRRPPVNPTTELLDEIKEAIQFGVATLLREGAVERLDWDTHSIILPYRYTARLKRLYDETVVQDSAWITRPKRLIKFDVEWSVSDRVDDLVFISKGPTTTPETPLCVRLSLSESGTPGEPKRYPIQ